MRKKPFLTILFFCVALFNNAQSQNDPFNSTVRVYALNSSTKPKGGTGFVVTINNKKYIATCYHVINNAERLQVFSIALKQFIDVNVVAYDDFKDLALLDAPLVNSIPAMDYSNIPNNVWKLNGCAVGNPNSNNEFILPVSFPSNTGVVSSKSFSDNNGKSIFVVQPEFDILPISSTIYGGMSGGPIIVNNHVIGVISGSENVGGSIGWGIPFNYLLQLPISHNLSSTLNLVDLKSLTANGRGLSRSLSFDDNATANFIPLQDAFQSLIDNFNKMSDYSLQANTVVSDYLSQYSTTAIGNNPTKFRLLIDSILVYNQLASQSEIDFYSSKKTYDDISDLLMTAFGNDPTATTRMDTALATKTINDAQALKLSQSAVQIVYTNKDAESTNAFNLITNSMFYDNSSIVRDAPQWKNFFEKNREKNIAAINHFKILLKNYGIVNDLNNIAYEALTYK